MHHLLQTFVDQRCVKHPSAHVPLADFMRAFRETIPASAVESWRRDRAIENLRRGGFAVGIINRVHFVGGLALNHQWREQGGQLVQVANG